MAKVCVHAYVSGKVQGVWYRQSTKEQALAQGVTGWAKNLADGRVETLLCGDEEAVNRVRDWLHEGPELAVVEAVQATQVAYRELKGFVTG
ncbi:MAG: acylphosphatase [Pseudomonadales bacterium]|jgi:acylphosphatase